MKNETNEYEDFIKLIGYFNYKNNGVFLILKETIENFFRCNVTFFFKPSSQLKAKFNIDIFENVRRGYYLVDENNVIIIARIISNKGLKSAFGILLTGDKIGQDVKLHNIFEGAITGMFTQEYNRNFQYGILAFGDELIKHIITNYFCHGYYDFRLFRHLMEYFFKLRTTSFEGNYFSTGAIITRSMHDYLDDKSKERNGQLYTLTNRIQLKSSNEINKRVWYLADGEKTFFLGNYRLSFTGLFVLNEKYFNSNYIENHSLGLSLKGGDALFKIENEKLFSMISSDGYEFMFLENKWKFRNYIYLKEILSVNISKDEKITESILYYVLTCSKKQISSILWFPKNIKNIDNHIIPKTKNVFFAGDLNLTDKRFENHIFRCLASDGVTVVDKNGNILHFGVIVDLNKTNASGLLGTGETAASILSDNGICIKISQDGDIKIFLNPQKDPVVF